MTPASLLTPPAMKPNSGRRDEQAGQRRPSASGAAREQLAHEEHEHAAVIAPSSAETSRIAHSAGEEPSPRAARYAGAASR